MKPTGWIRKDLLKVTPIGTSMEDVIAVVESNEKWKIYGIYEDRGYLVDENGKNWRDWVSKQCIIIGEKSIDVSLGDYAIHYVNAYYAFDENSNLIDILVYKTVDFL